MCQPPASVSPPTPEVPAYLVAAIVEGEEEEGGGGGAARGPPQLQLEVVPVAVVDLGVGQPQPGQAGAPLPDARLRLPLAQLPRGTSVPPAPRGGGAALALPPGQYPLCQSPPPIAIPHPVPVGHTWRVRVARGPALARSSSPRG